MPSFDFWQKQTQPLFAELAWNLPEQKTASFTVLGGNSNAFRSAYQITEYLNQTFPLKNLQLILPHNLKAQFPNSEHLLFAPATSSGSLAPSTVLESACQNADFNLFIGDFSKNTTTATAIVSALQKSSSPALLTRDSIDLIAPQAELWLGRKQLHLVISLAQLQKLFRTIYYPKMLIFSMPLTNILEILHKFTLTYPHLSLTTFHSGQIITAHHGQIITTALAQTKYSPLSLWTGQLAANIAVFNLFNPTKNLEASVAALFH